MSKSEIERYLSAIGSKGGKKSKRKLTKKQAKEMAQKRWEQQGSSERGRKTNVDT